MRARAVLPIALLAVAGVSVLAVLDRVADAAGRAVALLAAGDLGALGEYLRSSGLWAPLVSVALMQVQAVIAPLPSFPLMYVNGLLFGTLWGGLLSWASIFLSAILCFGMARGFGRPLVARLVSPTALAWADGHVVRHGPFAIFIARLIPLTSFDLLSYAAGLTPMRLGPFCLATGLGMTPAIFLSAAAGEIGLRSPWAFGGGLAAVAGLAGLALWLRPRLLQSLDGERQTLRAYEQNGR